MSGPVSENGIFLEDNVRIKRALEEERRILRLQQVRQESKNLSRKLRNEVTAEKERQLRKLQAIKEKEAEIWRHAVLKQKYGDYREAIYHIGDAHKNACAENDAKKSALDANKCQNKESLFRRQVRVRQTYGNYKAPPPPPPSLFKNSHSTNMKRFKRNCFTTKKHLNNLANSGRQRAGSGLKRKRHYCCHHQNSCGMQYECVHGHNEYDEDYLDDEVYSCCLSPTSNASDVMRENLDTPERNKLNKTAAVLLEVEDGFNFGAKQKPSEMKDKFVKENRQFSHVVRGSPEKRMKSATKSDNQTDNENNNNVKKPIGKHKYEPIKLPRFNKVSKLIEKLDAERQSYRLEMPTTSSAAMQQPTSTETEAYSETTLTTTETTPATAAVVAASEPLAAEPVVREEPKNKASIKSVQPKIIRAPLPPPRPAAAAATATTKTVKKPASKSTASKPATQALNARGRSDQRRSTTTTTVPVRKNIPITSKQPNVVHIEEHEEDTDDHDNDDDMQPSGSQKMQLSANVQQRSPQRISIHSNATGSISITVDQIANESTPAEHIETVIERQLPASQQPPSEPRKLESQYDVIQREREQACRDLKTLSDKLASLARDCNATVPSQNINTTNGGGTYRVAASTSSIEREIPSLNVEQTTKVDRASSPTIPVPIEETPKTIMPTTATTTTTTTTKSPASTTVTTFKKPTPLPRINYRENITDKGTKSPNKIQTSPTTKRVSKSPIKVTKSPTKVTTTTTSTTAKRQSENSNNNNNTKNKDSSLSSSGYSFVMLDYVADQSKLLRKDLNDELKSNSPNRYKCEKLQLLLERNEKLRKELNEKLEGRTKNRQTNNNNNDEIKSLISAVCEVRKEREELFNAAVLNVVAASATKTKTTTTRATTITPRQTQNNDELKNRELELKKKEKVLTQQLYELQQQQEQFVQQLQQQQQQQQQPSPTPETHTLRTVLQQEHATENEEPVEIVITVKGAKPLKKSQYANNMKNLTTNHVLKIKSTNDADAAKRKPSAQQSTPQRQASIQPQQQQQQQRTPIVTDNTYDSSSTHYRSLPQQLHINTNSANKNLINDEDDSTLNNIVTPNDEVVYPCTQDIGKRIEKKSSRDVIHPIVAQYVDRLLNMRRSSVKALGVSVSDVETPSESLINMTTNETRIADEFRERQAQVSRAERFIEENYLFIQDLEKTLVSQESVSLEKSMLLVEQLWKEYLKKMKSKRRQQQQQQQLTATPKTNTGKKEKTLPQQQQQQQLSQHETSINKTHDSISETIIKLAEANKIDTTTKCKKAMISAETAAIKTPEKSNKVQEKRISASTSPTTTKTAKVVRKSLEKPSTSKVATTTTTTKELAAETAATITTTISKKTKTKKPIISTFDGHETKNHFNELANSCSQRIIELNSMLARVREEKQHLLETTYSSVSLGSTEIVAPPPTRESSAHQMLDNKKISPEKVRPKSPEKKMKKLQQDDVEDEETTTSSSMRLLPDRNAAIAGSRDSGIGGSRPVTRQEQLPPQPLSQATVRTTIELDEDTIGKHVKPPATLKRYSPQFNDAEVTTAHELSTIVEVETPITSRLNTHADEDDEEKRARSQITPVYFPTFEQYLQLLHLDLTRIDPELSFQLAEQFDDLVKALEARDSHGVPNYTEFPSMAGYFRNLTQTVDTVDTEEPIHHDIPETTVGELISCLRLANLTVRLFPSHSEYTSQHLCRNSPASDMLDTASLENLSEDFLETDSDTINIEQELQKRKILHYAFSSDSKHEELDISITTKRTSPTNYRKSPNNNKNKTELMEKSNEHDMGTGNWASTMRRRIQETNALSSSTSSSPDMRVTSTTTAKKTKTAEMLVSAAKKNYLRNRSTTESVGDDDTIGSHGGRKMNLRDFLQRELTRYSQNTTGSSESNTTNSDYSLRKQFFQSILDSMTPQTQPSCGAAPPGSKNTDSSSKCLSSTLTDNLSSGFKPATQNNLTRQKTSTPVPANSTKSTTNTHGSQDSVASTLFSCESHISQVVKGNNN